MTWQCSRCREELDDRFHACWTCGTGRDEIVDPGFAVADAYEPPIQEQKSQFALRGLLKIVTALCVMFACWGATPDNLRGVLARVLGIGALGYIALHFISWALSCSAQSYQRDYPAHQNTD